MASNRDETAEYIATAVDPRSIGLWLVELEAGRMLVVSFLPSANVERLAPGDQIRIRFRSGTKTPESLGTQTSTAPAIRSISRNSRSEPLPANSGNLCRELLSADAVEKLLSAKDQLLADYRRRRVETVIENVAGEDSRSVFV